MDDQDRLKELLLFVESDQRVCPRLMEWQKFWESLPGAKRTSAGFTPTAPLVLAGWQSSSNEAKATRFREHIEWAFQHSAIDTAENFLRALTLEHWHHSIVHKPQQVELSR
jgi:hypothetical protein